MTKLSKLDAADERFHWVLRAERAEAQRDDLRGELQRQVLRAERAEVENARLIEVLEQTGQAVVAARAEAERIARAAELVAQNMRTVAAQTSPESDIAIAVARIAAAGFDSLAIAIRGGAS